MSLYTSSQKLKIAIVTSTRADWGLLSPLAHELKQRDDISLRIFATNMHFNAEYDYTWQEIVADGFKIDEQVPTHGTPSEIMSQTIAGFSNIFARIELDCIILLGDRFEILAVASAATLAKIPIIHIAGGAISEGAFDDMFRHAITKLSTLHLTETEEYRQRVIQMGESPDRVFNTGAIGVHNLTKLTLMSKAELEDSIGFTLTDKCLLVTLHPATLEGIPPLTQMSNLLAALDYMPDYRLLITHPNNDTDPIPLINEIERYRNNNPERVCVIPSLGRIRYLSALKYVSAVVGNSSSGIVEVPSAGIPTLDIGIRQRGRTAANSIVHCENSIEQIAEGLRIVTSDDMIRSAKATENPYYQPDTLQKMIDAIVGYDFLAHKTKRFYDIK